MHKERAGLAVLGLGSRSTLFYIQQLNARYHELKGGFSTCPFLLINADFDEINPYLPNQFDQLDIPLKRYLTRFEQLEIQHLLIPNITLHQAIDRLAPRIELIHPVHLAIEHFRESAQVHAVCFGSNYSMSAAYLKDHFSAAGIHLESPEHQDTIRIDEFRKKVYANLETARDVDEFRALVRRYSSQGNVLIACTELSLFLPDNLPMVFDMATMQIEFAVKQLLG